MNDLIGIRRRLERSAGERDRVIKDRDAVLAETETLERCSRRLEKAQAIIQEVAQATQKELQFHVSDLVSHALSAVFKNPYVFNLQFIVRRNKTEADMFWRRGSSDFLPNGGGVRDVSSFALRIAFWTISKDKSAPVLILDEPFRGLKPSSLQERAGRLLKEVSETLGVQIILISHDEAIAEVADVSYSISIKEGISNVTKNREESEGEDVFHRR